MTDTVKVLHFTTHDEECGIGKYQEQFLAAMKPLEDIENTIFPYSPNRTKMMSEAEFAPVLRQFSEQMREFDVLHVQHEFSFYRGSELSQIVSEAKRLGKKVIITVHTSLDAGFPTFKLRELRRVRTFLGKKRLSYSLTKTHVIPMRQADLVLTHNSVVESSLIKHGVKRRRITKIMMPVPVVSFDLKSEVIAKKLKKQKDDIIYCTVGFLASLKGTEQAIRALQYLPDNYKLAVIGGAHPSGDNDAFIREMEDLIREKGLTERTFMAGYIKSDAKLNALIRECDICIYPYDKKYYAGVTSAALNNALANHKPTIAYPTESIKEMNTVMPVVALCESFDYQTLAKRIKGIDLKKHAELSKRYSDTFSYDAEAKKMLGIYQKVSMKR